jgi:hypothetical protein
LSFQLIKNPVEILKIGDEILKILFEVRKFKSEKNLSMKTPIALLIIGSSLDLSSVSADLLNVTKLKFLDTYQCQLKPINLRCMFQRSDQELSRQSDSYIQGFQ